MTHDGTVLISGLGIAGPTLAYWLLRGGFTPTVVERAPAPRTGGYMIDFWGVGYDVAERMGLLPALHEDGYRIEEVRLVDASGRRVAGFDAELFRVASGQRFVSLLRGDLAHRLWECIASDVETIFGDEVTTLREDATGVEVRFEHASPRRFDLVVGADGLHSMVRKLAFGDVARQEHFLGYYTAAFLAHGYAHRDEGAYVSYAIPGGQVARYALRDGSSAFFFVFVQDTPLAVAPHDTSAQRTVLRDRFGGAGWECDEILDAMQRADDLYFDAVAQTRLDRWSRGRVTLVGDAAYCLSLLSGQGSALAMAGAYLLAHALAHAEGAHGVAFAAYQQRFEPLVKATQRSATRLGWWFAPRTRLGVGVRNLATKLMDVPHLAEWLTAGAFSDRLYLPSD